MSAAAASAPTLATAPAVSHRLASEALGTFILVLGGVGSAVFSAAFPEVGIGLLGVSLAFGLTVLGCAYALGPISGCHLNPAVTAGLAAAGQFPWRQVPGYVVAQLVGAAAAAGVLVLLLSGQAEGYDVGTQGLAANGYGPQDANKVAGSPGGFGVGAAFLAEAILTFVFLIVILGSTSWRAATGFAGIPIGLTLTLIHLVSIPITNTSVNPARSTGPALFVGGAALAQLWLFWVAPLLGGVLAGLVGRWLNRDRRTAAAA